MFTSHPLDRLYPEWDEFYLLVCDICGIIIRPQALEKHLASKHRISVQQSPQNQQSKQQHTKANHSQDNNQNNTIYKSTSLPNVSQNSTSNDNTSSNCVVNCDNKPQNGTHAQPVMPSKLWGGKHTLDSLPQPAIKRRPCDWVKVRRAPDTSLLTSSSSSSSSASSSSSHSSYSLLSSSPASLTGETPPKYQDRKWRNTFNVLRDTFF